MDLEISAALSTFCTAWKGTKISVGCLVLEIDLRGAVSGDIFALHLAAKQKVHFTLLWLSLYKVIF